ncbi:MAG: hypothetical protein ACRENS_10045 [Candidatus Eiseniibacteriota bacterium]
MTKRHGMAVLLLLVGLSAAGAARAQLPMILPRPGQVGITVQGQYGALLSTGNLGTDFNDSPGLAVRLRYRMRYERALGISFESQSFDAREPATADSSRTKLYMLLSGVDFYQMFNTDQRTQQMISIGAGLAQIHYTLRDGEIEYPLAGDGVYVSVGAGMERFVYRSFAIDLSTRYMAVFEDGKANHDFQAAAGLIFYATY